MATNINAFLSKLCDLERSRVNGRVGERKGSFKFLVIMILTQNSKLSAAFSHLPTKCVNTRPDLKGLSHSLTVHHPYDIL